MAFFQCKYTVSNENMTFISIKEEEKHLIWPSQCKYAFSDVYPRGSAAVDMFLISNISEFGLGGRGGSDFSIISEIQNILNYPRGWGFKPTLELFPNFPVFLSDASPYFGCIR